MELQFGATVLNHSEFIYLIYEKALINIKYGREMPFDVALLLLLFHIN